MPAEIIDDWRTWDRIQQLADFCGLSEKNKCFLESLHGVSNINISNTVTVQDYIIKEAQEYYRNVKNGLQGSGISWVADPTAAHEEDRIVSMYLHFVKIALAHNVHHNEKYLNVCKMFLHASPADIFHRTKTATSPTRYSTKSKRTLMHTTPNHTLHHTLRCLVLVGLVKATQSSI